MAFILTIAFILAIMVLAAMLVGLTLGGIALVWVNLKLLFFAVTRKENLIFCFKWFMLIWVSRLLFKNAPQFIFATYCMLLTMYMSYCICTAIAQMYTRSRKRTFDQREARMRAKVEAEMLAKMKFYRSAKKSGRA
jgi:hypothetical protein